MVEQSGVFLPPERQSVARAQASVPPKALPLLQGQPALSIVIPTKNEAGNIAALVERLNRALSDIRIEIVFVDDSDDATIAAIELARDQADSAISLIHRNVGERAGGLGGAVLAGLRATTTPWVCVMDADLQHPPELVPQMLAKAQETASDLVIASRYCADGAAHGLNHGRSLISRSSTATAHLLFPKRLRDVTDPMSGFFLMRRDAIAIDRLQPQGFKILLEIMVRSPGLRIDEVGFEFGKRYAGESKASFHEGLRYLSHLAHLRLGHGTMQFMRFMAVGLSGLFVNSLVLWLATELLGLHYLVSLILATQGSTLWNFALTELWVFTAPRERQGRLMRLLMFLVMNNAALTLRGPMVYVLTSIIGVYYLTSNVVSLVTLTILRYTVADKWIWGRSTTGGRTPALHNYNIHGLITVASEVGLPELEQFRVASALEQPTLRVALGKVQPPENGRSSASGTTRYIAYDEGLGLAGFGINVTLGSTISILASPVLRWSPHVLYTNVVEPILRWTFVEKGFALVHGACVSFGDKAYMITARTDTGKTTTILRLLDRQRRSSDKGAFLSDDLTLVAPDGRVLTYPKPLTISQHTVAAINTPRLAWKERLTLPLQSRLHSRDGRKFAMWLAQRNLPVATINTIVQLLVPPPKYHVQQLVPHARVAHDARLAGLIVIERGADADVTLESQEGLDILLANCEDAYGFPPYETIKTVLHSTTELDLRAVERDIIEQALHGLPATLLRSSKMDWSFRIPALVAAPELLEDWAPRERSVGDELALELGTT